jgi:hypothetical protein
MLIMVFHLVCELGREPEHHGFFWRDAKYPPWSTVQRPFWGLTVQPCDEPCGSAAGFDFLTVKVIQIGKKMPFISA